MIIATVQSFIHHHPTHACDLKVKVTDIEIIYLIPDNVKFMTTNDHTIAQEILSRAKMPLITYPLTVMILSFGTDRPKLTVQTGPKEQSDQGLHCDSVC